MNLPGRSTIQTLPGGEALWRALDRLALGMPDQRSGTWIATDASGAGLIFIPTMPARYLRHGRQVQATTGIRWPVTASAAPAKIGGLPVRASAGMNSPVIVGYTSCGFAVTAVVVMNTTELWFFTTTGVPATNAQLSDTQVQCTALYLTD